MNHHFIVDIKRYCNNIGITTFKRREEGELTVAGTSLPQENIKINELFHIHGIPFILNKNEHYQDNIETMNQKILLKNTFKIKKIYFLTNTCYGSYFQNITIGLINGDKINKKIYSCDTILKQPEFRDVKLGLSFQYLHNHEGKNESMSGNIWIYELELEESSDLNYIQFEDNPMFHIFSITLEGVKK